MSIFCSQKNGSLERRSSGRAHHPMHLRVVKKDLGEAVDVAVVMDATLAMETTTMITSMVRKRRRLIKGK